MSFERYNDRRRAESHVGFGAQRGVEARLAEAYLLDLDPAVDGFGPVFIELYVLERAGFVVGFEVRQTATVTANRLFVFRTGVEELARAVYDGEASPRSLACYDLADVG